MKNFQADFLHALTSNQLEPLRNQWFSQYSPQEFETRFKVYADSIFMTFERSLKKIFRPVIVLLGEETSSQLFRAYSSKNLAEHFDLNSYGKDFGRFIQDTVPWFSDYPYLREFANFCWHWHQVFLSPDHQPVLLRYQFPVYEIWKRCQPEFQGSFELADASQETFCYELFRENKKVYVLERTQSSA